MGEWWEQASCPKLHTQDSIWMNLCTIPKPTVFLPDVINLTQAGVFETHRKGKVSGSSAKAVRSKPVPWEIQMSGRRGLWLWVEKQSRVGKVGWVMEGLSYNRMGSKLYLGSMEPLTLPKQQHNLLRIICWPGTLGEDKGREISQKTIAAAHWRSPRLILSSHHEGVPVLSRVIDVSLSARHSRACAVWHHLPLLCPLMPPAHPCWWHFRLLLFQLFKVATLLFNFRASPLFLENTPHIIQRTNSESSSTMFQPPPLPHVLLGSSPNPSEQSDGPLPCMRITTWLLISSRFSSPY